MFKKYYFIVLIILILSSNVTAAEQPDIGDVLQETEEKPQIEQQKEEIPQIKGEEIEEPLQDLSGQKVMVKKIEIIKNNMIDSKTLESLVNTEEYTNKKLTFSQMEKAALEITRYYREQGYFVARAYIPKQEMKEGMLKIAVIEGQYGQFKLQNESLVRDQTLQSMLDSIKNNEIISVNTIERAMLIINDTPGSRVTQADIMPGEQLGTSDFAITAEATDRYSGYLVADNYGGEYTGKERLSTALDINSPFKLGDKISLNAMLTDESALENYRLAYSLPLTATGLRMEMAYGETEYELGGIYSNLEAVGSSKDLELNFNFPAVRTRSKNLNFYANLNKRDLNDEILNQKTEKENRKLDTGFSYTKNHSLLSWNSQQKIDFNLTIGELDFKDPNQDTENTEGRYSKLNINLAENMVFNQKWSLDSSIEMQYSLSDDNLDGSEDLSIGGANGVKLYPSGEFSAENGYLFNLELFYELPKYKNIASRLSIFYDQGRADMAEETPGFKDRTLKDMGIGYHLNYNNLFAKIYWAHKIDNEDITSEDDYDDKLLIQMGYVF